MFIFTSPSRPALKAQLSHFLMPHSAALSDVSSPLSFLVSASVLTTGVSFSTESDPVTFLFTILHGFLSPQGQSQPVSYHV